MQIAMTRTQFTSKVVELAEKFGVHALGDEGSLQHSGVSVDYHYDGTVLTIEVLHKPFFVTEAYVEGEITAWFASAASPAGLNTTGSAIVALLLVCVMFLTGCTPQQKQTTLQVVTEINTHIPEVEAAADTVAATVAALIPADAPLVGVSDLAFDTAAKTLQSLTAAYVATPTASTLVQIQTAITTLEGQINTATLTVAGIKNVATQQAVLAALKGLLTVVTVVFALISPTLTTAQLEDLRNSRTTQLARVRRYMDERQLQAELPGVNVDRAFRQAEAFGF